MTTKTNQTNPINNEDFETKYKELQEAYKTLQKEKEDTQKQLMHFVDELRFILGIAVQARPEMEEVKIMVKELYRIGE